MRLKVGSAVKGRKFGFFKVRKCEREEEGNPCLRACI